MATKNQQVEWQHADSEVRKSLPPGVKLVRTLRGNMSRIGSIAWSPDGRLLASSDNRTIRLWNAGTGECLSTFEGQEGAVNDVAFDPKGIMLASGGNDGRVKIWDLADGTTHTDFTQYKHKVFAIAWSKDGKFVSFGGTSGDVWLLDADSGKRIDIAKGVSGSDWTFCLDWSPPIHGSLLAFGTQDAKQSVICWDPLARRELWSYGQGRNARYTKSLCWSPTQPIIACGFDDHLVRILDSASGRHLRTLEFHEGAVTGLTFSNDGRVLATHAMSGQNLSLWRCDKWSPVASFQVAGTGVLGGLIFHPNLPLLARVGSDGRTEKGPADGVIHIYELDLDLLLGQAAEPFVSYTSAKVVLVGESNVGKSYLAHRIATGEPPEKHAIKSTHGMKFWPLEPERLSPVAKAPADQRRDVVLWDMGGQDEYRLIHQLFLHDTTLALVLFDPTRGASAFKEVETWNKALENQLKGRAAVKLLVGAKLDQPSNTVDEQRVQRLIKDCGFAGYYETSALTGRGVGDLCEAASKAIDWDGLGKTSRPALFQRVRDEIESRRKRGVVVLHLAELIRTLSTTTSSDNEEAAVSAVTEQLASQGVIARSRVSTGEPVLVLQVQEIERYAGSLIIAAKKNPRGVPALELRAIAQEIFPLPGIPDKERLPREQEKPVLECTVQLMLEHGICFQHEGLLIFPSLFAPASEGSDGKLLHSVSLYYDFAGAIDNIYASLVAWLVLAKEFGKVRLWSDRAEFEVKDGGLCGLRKIGRPGGFAHVDVYFDQETPDRQRKEFISFVEDHLARNGVEIREHVAIKCPCNHEFTEETLRQRIVRGDKDVVCPVCEKRHSLTEGASEARERDARIIQHTWALRTRIERLRERITTRVVYELGEAENAKPATGPIRLLHLSDLHFTAATPVAARLQWLLDDLKQDSGLGFKELDYLVISGDFTDKGGLDGFEKAYEFVSGLTQEFGLSAERCIFVPGNHDLRDLRESYDWRDKSDGLSAGEWVKKDDIILARNKDKYPLRLKAFSDAFFHKFVQRPYPLEFSAQGIAIPFWESGIQFLTLNSCWQIDQFHRKRSGVSPEAVATAIRQAQQQKDLAKKMGQLRDKAKVLRLAVWHHAVVGPEQMTDTEFLTNLQKAGVRVGMHGDVHRLHRDVVGHWHEQGKQLHILGAGSFGSPPEGRPESMPRLYNVLEIDRNLTSMRVHTRQQPTADGAWTGWHEWPNPKDLSSKVAYYDIDF